MCVCVCVCVCAYFGGTSAHVSICQRTYVSMRQQTRQYAHLLLLRRRVLAYAGGLVRVLVARRLVKRHSGGGGSVSAANVSIPQHTSAYTYYSISSVRILKAHRALTSEHTSAYAHRALTNEWIAAGVARARSLSLPLLAPASAQRHTRVTASRRAASLLY